MEKTNKRKIHTLEKLTDRINDCFKKKDYYGLGVTATGFCASFYWLKQLYPESVDEVIKNAVKQYGMFDLENAHFQALETEDLNYLRTIVTTIEKQTPAATSREFNEEEQKVIVPLQMVMDIMDPEMFKVVDIKENDGIGTVICTKNKKGTSKVVAAINDMKSKNLKCKIDSKELIITITEDGMNEMLEFMATALESARSEQVSETVVDETVVANSNYDLDAIAAQYGTSIADLQEKLKTQEGMQWIMNKMDELAKENANDPDVQKLAGKQAETKLSAVSEEEIKLSNELVDKNEALKSIDKSFRASQLTPVFSKGLQGLTNVALYFNDEKKCDVTMDIKKVVLGPEIKWSPVIPETPSEALDAPWFMVELQDTWNLLHGYVFGTVAIENLAKYTGIGRLYSPEYKYLNAHINMNEVFRSKVLENKPIEDIESLYAKLKELGATEVLRESTEIDGGTYYRLFNYKDSNNFELISDGKTKNWLNGNKPLPVKKALKIACRDGKWFAEGAKPNKPKTAKKEDSKKESLKEEPKAAEATA